MEFLKKLKTIYEKNYLNTDQKYTIFMEKIHLKKLLIF